MNVSFKIRRFFSLFLFLLAAFLPKKSVAQCSTTTDNDCQTACYWPLAALVADTFTTDEMIYDNVSFCGSSENTYWLIVDATTTTTTFTATAICGTCDNGDGLQLALFDQCGGTLLACHGGGQSGACTPRSITASGLTPGNQYYLMIDGYAGDQCDFTISVSPRTPPPPPILYVIRGSVELDTNKNCQPDSLDLAANGWTIRNISSVGDTTFHLTDASGHFEFTVAEIGTHEVRANAVGPDGLNYDFCQNPIQVNLSTTADTGEAHFLAQLHLDTIYLISGTVEIDVNQNCQRDSLDLPAFGWPVRHISPSNDTAYFYTDSLGRFEFFVQEIGVHILQSQYTSPNGKVFQFCQNQIVATISLNAGTAEAHFLARPILECTFLTCSAYLPILRVCHSEAATFLVKNETAFPIFNADISTVISFPFVVDSTEIPPIYQAADSVIFHFDTIAPNSQFTFKVYGHIPCNTAYWGTMICADIWGEGMICDTLGAVGAFASLKTSAVCNDSAVVFTIDNVGSGPTSGDLIYIIVEDEVVMTTAGVPAGFGPNQILSFAMQSDGSALRIEVEQEPSPLAFSEYESAGIAGCGGLAPDSTFLAQWPNGSNQPWHGQFCRQILQSFDPNQKTALPIGFQKEHFIRPNTDIDYTIDFQNVGADTAFFVQILDTMPTELDPMSIRNVWASHPMTWEFFGSGIFRTTFWNIVLPDSASDEKASKGFVRFKISQKKDLADWTKIENRAAIIFDINAPVITGEAFHTVCEKCWQVVPIKTPEAPTALEVRAVPNPFSEKTTLEIDAAPEGEMLFKLVDLTGRTVFSTFFEGKRLEISSNGLASGVYFFSIEKEGARLATGKIFAQR